MGLLFVFEFPFYFFFIFFIGKIKISFIRHIFVSISILLFMNGKIKNGKIKMSFKRHIFV